VDTKQRCSVSTLTSSVNGDKLQGATRVAVFHPESTEYRPKWGLYRRASAGSALGDDYIEHKDVTARKLPAPPEATVEADAALENAARKIARDSTPEEALQWLQSQPASPGRDLAVATIAAQWAESDPAAAMAWTETLEHGDGRSTGQAPARSAGGSAAPAGDGSQLRLQSTPTPSVQGTARSTEAPARRAGGSAAPAGDGSQLRLQSTPTPSVQGTARSTNPGDVRTDATQRVFNRWLDLDLSAAMQWLATPRARSRTRPARLVPRDRHHVPICQPPRRATGRPADQ
jgi:hypothetical protein